MEGALEAAASECGLRLRRLDKKSERAASAALRSKLAAALELESAPAAGLALAVPLTFHKATGVMCVCVCLGGGIRRQRDHAAACLTRVAPPSPGRLVSVPGRALGGVLQRLQLELPEPSYQLLQGFHDAVVESLKLASAEGAESAARAAALGEQLAAQLPALKALAGLGAQGV